MVKTKKVKWSPRSIKSFNMFEIDGVSIPGRRAFKYKKKTLYVNAWCKRFMGDGHDIFNIDSYVFKKLKNGDEVWRCGECSDLHNRGDMIFDYDQVPSKEVKTYYIFEKSLIEEILEKLKKMKKKEDSIRVFLEIYKPKLLETIFE